MFSSQLMAQEYERLLPDYEAYKERVLFPYARREPDQESPTLWRQNFLNARVGDEPHDRNQDVQCQGKP
jgi:hypothetical protein